MYKSTVGLFQREWCTSTRLRYSFLCACAVAGFYLLAAVHNGYDTSVFYQMTLSSLEPPIFQDGDQELSIPENREDRFTIYSEGCIIPKIMPFDPRIAKFIEWPRDITKCPRQDQPLLNFNESHIWLNKHNYKYYGVAGNENHVKCCYRAFYRPHSVQDVYSPYIDDRIKYKKCLSFSQNINVHDEFVRVDCYFNETTLDVQYFVFAVKKPAKVQSSEENNGNAFSNSSFSNSSYSVLILGIDAVSRMNFHRTMPKTLSYLKSKDAVELLGYNKVGDNTFPNLVAMLLGISEAELQDTCWPSWRQPFDNCPFIWNTFKRKGYLTAFGEDYAGLGTFNYQKNGFIQKPTDYYLHPFISEAQQIRNTKHLNSHLCMGNRYFFKVLLDHVESLISTVQPSKLFGLFWEATMSHDYLNYPVVMDLSYVKLLKEIDYLNNTIVFLVSDHGMRWGAIRETRQGRLEERLPFVYILTPESFRKHYKKAYKNLKLNVRRLTTPFDIHATLNDLANLGSIQNSEIEIRSKESYTSKRAISLFLPIPGNRTCQSAAIEDHWCTCHSERKLDVKDKNIQEAARFVVSRINSLVHAHRECAKLTLSKVLEAMEMTAMSVASELTETEFLIVVQTTPGDGVFEATVHKRKNDAGNLELSIPATISRLNIYANQSHCVHGSHLKLYCYCK